MPSVIVHTLATQIDFDYFSSEFILNLNKNGRGVWAVS